jgi:predicted Holliday junction resolvase-like endonuclease
MARPKQTRYIAVMNLSTSASTESILIAAFIIGAVAAIFVVTIVYQFRFERLRVAHQRELKETSRRSVEQSRSTLKGQMAEQMAPFLAGFDYLPADSRFLGDPVDYVVFRGRSMLNESDDAEDDLEIVLVEVKQGQSKLSRIQKAIALAVEEGRVRFEINRVADDGTITRTEWKRKRLAA